MLPQVWSLLKAILKYSFGFASGNMRMKLIQEEIDVDMRAYNVCVWYLTQIRKTV